VCAVFLLLESKERATSKKGKQGQDVKDLNLNYLTNGV